jgi:biotin transport system substrate-specific component
VTAIAHRPATLADVLPLTRVRTAIVVVGFALLTAAAAQVTFVLPWTPVPITGQTFAVLLAGAALGAGRGAASQVLYVGLGATGLPFYADGQGGWHAATGATAGYLVGFVLAAAVVGALAERRHDRTLLTSIPAMLTGTATIYLCGTLWLAHHLSVDGATAVELGLAPFVIGDAVKLVLAGAVLPATWFAVRRFTDHDLDD